MNFLEAAVARRPVHPTGQSRPRVNEFPHEWKRADAVLSRVSRDGSRAVLLSPTAARGIPVFRVSLGFVQPEMNAFDDIGVEVCEVDVSYTYVTVNCRLLVIV